MYIFLFFLLVFPNFQVKFPQNFLGKNIILSKIELKEDIFISYDLSNLKPFWCENDVSSLNLKQVFLVCYSGTINLDKFLNTFTPKERETSNDEKKAVYISTNDVDAFKFYYFLKRKFLKNSFCLLKEKNKFKITYSNNDEVSIKEFTALITEYQNLEKIELENNFLFFIASFKSSCEKDIFYFQTSIYNFYETEKLFNKKNWTDKIQNLIQL